MLGRGLAHERASISIENTPYVTVILLLEDSRKLSMSMIIAHNRL